MFEYVLNQKGSKFYSLNEDIIIEAEKEMGIIFPEELRSFYIQIGYGFLNTKRDNFNRIMDPYSVCEFRFRTGQFANIFELDIYESYEKDKLVFFEICEGVYLSIGFSKNNNGKIYYGKEEIAINLREFLKRYQEDENYFDEN